MHGNRPIYLGFSSNPQLHPEKFNQLFLEVVNATVQRLIISKSNIDWAEENAADVLDLMLRFIKKLLKK